MATESTGSSYVAADEPSVEILEDLCCKFIFTAPKDALSKDRVFFLVEQAWWYYEDKVRPMAKSRGTELRHYSSYATFAEPLFRKVEVLKPLRPNLQAYLEDYRKYKQGIPVYGAILLDAAMEQVLLVRGNKSSMGWGFPRGKVNEGETEATCAIREVLEETGYDIRSQLREPDYIEVTADGKRHKLYIVTGLDPTTQEFEPHSKWEIGAYAWHRVDALPATSDEASQVYMSADGVRHRFFMIHPFVGRLRKWISKRKSQVANRQASGAGVAGGGAAGAAAGGGGGGGGGGGPGQWSATSSAASSMFMSRAELQAHLATLTGPSQPPGLLPATPPAASAAAGGAAAATSSTASSAQHGAGQGQAQGGRSGGGGAAATAKDGGKVSRLAHATVPGGGAANGRQQQQQQQQVAAEAEKQSQVKLLQHVSQKLGQLQQQQQAQGSELAGGAEAGPSAAWAPSMSRFRFDRDSLLKCFAVPGATAAVA
ncbi:hypothetical protein HXX76_007523 [Chlamydomonas incerta]|uniref:Nudix hydrolase domain-containing protein n=1 Tax=Chlamydomonas incerta TaxID=51695 RepID=A0A835T2C5_CHLIN|nr:hypothetical protein HXX76_007523 [Chlamydomonas incerta]|eukprot:KAG2434628.1 hypothetical protein HXX76_007523 [Chlamydomonas incerta]